MTEPPPATVAEFLASYRFDTARAEETGSGFTPLVMAALAGNGPVVRELIAVHGVDVHARVIVDDKGRDFGIERGMGALGIAAGLCPQQDVHDVVSALLEAGADPNGRFESGGTPLIAAVVGQSLEGVRSLLGCAGDKIDLELGLVVNNASAINLAGVMGTYAILECLIRAGADTTHKNDNGGFLLSDIACNPIADPGWFELVCGSLHEKNSVLREDINTTLRPLNTTWNAINAAARMLLRLGISRNSMVMDLAESSGATLLSCTAQYGNHTLVLWLLQNGAHRSIHSRNRLGHSPLDISRIFGPHREVTLFCH